MKRQYIKVTGEYEGFHWYEDAPEQVAFLKLRHRHLFKWDAVIEVFHHDRELEFFMVKHVIKNEICQYVNMLDNLGSCESQANRILDGLIAHYSQDRVYQVTVSEDGENGGTVVWRP
jgi:Fe-S cluster assembly scaffold protein SufB